MMSNLMNTEQHPGVIYIFTNPIGERYIGRTIDYNRRMNSYRSNDRHGDIGSSIDEYGFENHDYRPLMQGIAIAVLMETEAALIRLIKPELNKMAGGAGGRLQHSDDTKRKMSASGTGRKHKPESKAKISAALSGENNPMFGVKHSDETRAKMSVKTRGIKKTPEHCANISAGKLGTKYTAEHCANISAAKLGKKIGPKSPEAVEKTAAWHRGRKRPQETCDKIAKARREHGRTTRKHNRMKELRKLGWPVEMMSFPPVVKLKYRV